MGPGEGSNRLPFKFPCWSHVSISVGSTAPLRFPNSDIIVSSYSHTKEEAKKKFSLAFLTSSVKLYSKFSRLRSSFHMRWDDMVLKGGSTLGTYLRTTTPLLMCHYNTLCLPTGVRKPLCTARCTVSFLALYLKGLLLWRWSCIRGIL